MSLLAADPFSLLGISRNAGLTEIQNAYNSLMEISSPEEREELEKSCAFLLTPGGLAYARLALPGGGKSFNQLKNGLPPRPRYLGPGKWKKVLGRMLQDEDTTSLNKT